MNIENRYVKDRRVHVKRRLGTTLKGYIGQERRAITNRRSYPWKPEFWRKKFGQLQQIKYHGSGKPLVHLSFRYAIEISIWYK